MAKILNLTEGWTERIQMQCLGLDPATREQTTAALAGTVELRLFPRGSDVPRMIAGTVGILDAATRTVYYDPDPSDLIADEYSVRIRNTVGGRISEYPQGEPNIWRVRKP